MWVWVHEHRPIDADAVARFAQGHGVAEAFVSVPGAGPSAATRRCAAALRGAGVRVSALGGDPAWVEGDDAVAWTRRALDSGLFDGVHLDIEPWGRPDWHGRERELLAGLTRTVRDVVSTIDLPVEVDLAPWLADEHPGAFAQIAAAAHAVTLMAYRDRAPAILAFSAAARQLLADADRPYRLGVETMPGLPAHVSFADDGRAVLEHELALVADAVVGEPGFAGLAVHDAEHWMGLPQ